MGLIKGLKMRYWMWCLMVLCYSGREDAVEALYIHRSLAIAPHSVSIHINLEPRCVFQIVVGFELFTAHTVFPGNLMYARSRFHSLALSGRSAYTAATSNNQSFRSLKMSVNEAGYVLYGGCVSGIEHERINNTHLGAYYQ